MKKFVDSGIVKTCDELDLSKSLISGLHSNSLLANFGTDATSASIIFESSLILLIGIETGFFRPGSGNSS